MAYRQIAYPGPHGLKPGMYLMLKPFSDGENIQPAEAVRVTEVDIESDTLEAVASGDDIEVEFDQIDFIIQPVPVEKETFPWMIDGDGLLTHIVNFITQKEGISSTPTGEEDDGPGDGFHNVQTDVQVSGGKANVIHMIFGGLSFWIEMYQSDTTPVLRDQDFDHPMCQHITVMRGLLDKNRMDRDIYDKMLDTLQEMEDLYRAEEFGS